MRFTPVSIAAALAIAVLLLFPAAGSAQATVDGFVYDSIHNAPLVGASIRIGKSGQLVSTDSLGRFRVAGVAEGTHEVSVRHPILDSLGVPAAAKKVTLPKGGTTFVDLGIPSGRTLLAGLCPRQSSELNGVLGVVRDAETDAPVPRASVRLSWSVIVLDRTLGVVRQPEYRVAQSDANGLYVVCDAPADLDAGAVIAFGQGYTSAHAETAFANDGVAVQHLYLGRVDAAPGTLVGTILSQDGAPLADAEVYPVEQSGQVDTTADTPNTRTNPQGMFALSGLRAGTQMIELRRLGFQRTRRTVVLSPGRATTIDPVTMPTMIARLPEVTVREKSTAEQFGFHDRRKIGRGRFLTREDLAEHKQILRSSDIIRELIPGMRLEMKSGQMVITNESLRQNIKGETCALPVYIDGVPAPTDLALDIVPADIDGMEIYNAPEMVPAEFSMRSADGSAPCGAILIWTTWRNRKTPRKP